MVPEDTDPEDRPGGTGPTPPSAAVTIDLPTDAVGEVQLSPLRPLLALLPLAVIALVGSNLLGLWSLGLVPEVKRPMPTDVAQKPDAPPPVMVPAEPRDAPLVLPDALVPDFNLPAPPVRPAPPPFNLALVLERLPTADAEAGAQTFRMCTACHTAEKGAAHKIGPNLWGVFENIKGAQPEYNYSMSLKAVRGTWTAAELARFLNNPRTALPGTTMAFRGIEDPARLANLIAYLAILRDGPSR